MEVVRLNKAELDHLAKMAAGYCGYEYITATGLRYVVNVVGDHSYVMGTAPHDPAEMASFESDDPSAYPHIAIAMRHPSQKLFPPGTFLYSKGDAADKASYKICKTYADLGNSKEIAYEFYRIPQFFERTTEQLHEEWSSDFFEPVDKSVTRDNIIEIIEIICRRDRTYLDRIDMELLWPTSEIHWPYKTTIDFFLRISEVLSPAKVPFGYCEYGQASEDVVYNVNLLLSKLGIEYSVKKDPYRDIWSTDLVIAEIDQELESIGYRSVLFMPDGEGRSFTLIHQADYDLFDQLSERVGRTLLPATWLPQLMGEE